MFVKVMAFFILFLFILLISYIVYLENELQKRDNRFYNLREFYIRKKYKGKEYWKTHPIEKKSLDKDIYDTIFKKL